MLLVTNHRPARQTPPAAPRPPADPVLYRNRQIACEACLDSVCRKCPKTELERRAADGRCPLGFWRGLET